MSDKDVNEALLYVENKCINVLDCLWSMKPKIPAFTCFICARIRLKGNVHAKCKNTAYLKLSSKLNQI